MPFVLGVKIANGAMGKTTSPPADHSLGSIHHTNPTVIRRFGPAETVVKVIKYTVDEVAFVRSEIASLKRARHPNIVKFYGSYRNSTHVYL